MGVDSYTRGLSTQALNAGLGPVVSQYHVPLSLSFSDCVSRSVVDLVASLHV